MSKLDKNIFTKPEFRRLIAFTHDITAATLAWVLAYLFRFNFDIPVDFGKSIFLVLAISIPIQASFFWAFGLYRGVWRFASIPDLQRILKAVLTAAVSFAALLILLRVQVIVPRSILILDPLLLILMMGGSRFVYRAWNDHHLYRYNQLKGKPVLVLGAGEAVIALIKDLAKSEEWSIVGLLDDDQAIHNRELLGIKVLGSIDQLRKCSQRLSVDHVIVAMPGVEHQERRRAVELANACGLNVMTVPAFDDLMSGKVSVSQIRKVDVEDLLGREPVRLDDAGLHGLIDSKVVLVTGAGGSIGSELCRQVVRFQPELLICYDLSEFSLYSLEQEFLTSSFKTKILYVLGDVKNDKRLWAVLKNYQPNVVFHAAAYKHVPLIEKENVSEALSNNVVGTYIIAKACKESGVEKFVLVSTDKAVNPTNVMGASKRLAEMVCQGLQEETGTRFVIVRFGNVLGSSGSVIPKFREQIAKGGPVTVTHPDITRFFMSIPEAAQLVMQAGLMGTGAEIFVLDMGEPVKIAELAKDMIRLSGLQEDEIEIVYTGLRPGEKLYEELLADDELTLPTPHEKLRIAIARTADKLWVKALLKWIETTNTLDEEEIKQQLKMWVEEYTGDINGLPLEAKALQTGQSTTIH